MGEELKPHEIEVDGQILPNSLVLETPKETDAVYGEIFGDIGEIAGASFDWRQSQPTLEKQGFGDCVTFSRLNCAESVGVKAGIKDDYGEELNFSDLELAVNSETTQSGNSMSRVADRAYKAGVVLERVCPYTYDWNERAGRVAAIPKTARRYPLGNYSWIIGSPVKKGTKAMIQDALQYSPVQIGIGLNADYNTADIVPKTNDYRAYHAITLQFIDENGIYNIFDHYDKKNKRLAADYEILYALSFRDLPDGWKAINVSAARLLARLTGKYILRAESHGELYRVFPDRLAKLGVTSADPELRAEFNAFLKGTIKVLGISEPDFVQLTSLVKVVE